MEDKTEYLKALSSRLKLAYVDDYVKSNNISNSIIEEFIGLFENELAIRESNSTKKLPKKLNLIKSYSLNDFDFSSVQIQDIRKDNKINILGKDEFTSIDLIGKRKNMIIQYDRNYIKIKDLIIGYATNIIKSQRYDVQYYQFSDLSQILIKPEKVFSLKERDDAEKVSKAIRNCRLLIIDGIAELKSHKNEATAVFELVMYRKHAQERLNAKSIGTILVSSKELDAWNKEYEENENVKATINSYKEDGDYFLKIIKK